MANFFASLFGMPEKKNLNLGQTPPKNLQFSQVGADLQKQILAGLTGENYGFGADFVAKSTNPIVAQREARWAETEKPELMDYYGGSGLGRSTIAGNKLSQASQAKERDINQVIADAYYKDLQQRKADEERMQNLALEYAQADINQMNKSSADEMARRDYQIGQEQASDLAETQAYNRMIGLPISIGTSLATGNATPVLAAFGIPTSGLSESSQNNVFDNWVKNVFPFLRDKQSAASKNYFANLKPEDLL